MNQLCYYVVQTNGAPMRTIESKLSHPPLTRSARQTWVQTDRAAHEAWGHLVHKSPRAAALMHHLVAHMDQSAAVVASYATLAKICGFSVATVRRAVDDLKSRQWIQVVQIGGKGAANAFVVNSRVAWAANRDMLLWRHSQPEFSQVQTSKMQKHWMARLFDVSRILRAGERQLPTGPGEDPPSQPAIEGMEPDLPSLQAEQEQQGNPIP